MNALQRLIADWLSEHPGETYSSIARRGDLPRQTVNALAKRARARQTPRPDTISKLAKGLRLDERTVREAAGLSAGYGIEEHRDRDDKYRLLIATLESLDEERLDAVARRARALRQEQIEEEAETRRRRRRRNRRDPGQG
ncbi:MAG: hypothetical protein ACRDYU_03865 [Actinomycetes bacterium]